MQSGGGVGGGGYIEAAKNLTRLHWICRIIWIFLFHIYPEDPFSHDMALVYWDSYLILWDPYEIVNLRFLDIYS